jgi:Fur family transcriptional regulator, ferric uptake regulator
VSADLSSWREHARSELRRAGSRAGGARNAVIDYLASHDCCVSAQELHDGLRAEGRAVGIASVYRAVEQLAALRLVHKVDLADGVTRFEPALPGGEHHHHLVCGGCGKVETFDDVPLERALTRVAGARGYDLEQHDVVLHGSCGDCRAA